jgi:hypothetical protein
LRADQPSERIHGCLKAAEVVCRYLAGLALSSLSVRKDEESPETIKPLSGDLAFGDFLSVVQAVSKIEGHPLTPYLTPFRPKGKGKKREPGKADVPLVALLKLRNELGHDLAALSKAKAITILQSCEPERLLLDALGALDGVLGLPLFVLDNVSIERKQIIGRRLLLMGESPDPIFDNVELTTSLEKHTPYVAVSHEVIELPPMVIFELIEEQSAFRLAFLDGIDTATLRFKTLESNTFHDDNQRHTELMRIFEGERRRVDEVRLANGSTLRDSWVDQRRIREEAGLLAEGQIPWDNFSQETLSWYAQMLPESECVVPQDKIIAMLLDGRSTGLLKEELKQLQLLFGDDRVVRNTLGRELYDFRSKTKPGARWDNRSTGTSNILSALQVAVLFFADHVGVGADEVNDLTKTNGSADYIAMREALVNQFIHQDYDDRSAAAQVELVPNRAMFFNTGYSLVTTEHLTDGGKSQARNPLIARALRLIGYAELAGSGIRALQYEWRNAKRRPPVIESDRDGNTFTLTLDWREVPNAYGEVWKKKIGVQLSPEQATILNIATDPGGISEHQAAAGSGLNLDDAKEVLRFLVHQVLLEEQDGRFHLKPHLKDELQ